MLIYENNNKLNINFDNEVSENPDLQIGKEDGKTEVLINGQPVGGGSVLVIDDTNEKVDLTVANPLAPDSTIDIRGIIVNTEMDIGTIVVEAHHSNDSSLVEYTVSPKWTYVTMIGIDPSLVSENRYTITGSQIAWLFGENLELVIIPPSLAKDLIPGTRHSTRA